MKRTIQVVSAILTGGSLLLVDELSKGWARQHLTLGVFQPVRGVLGWDYLQHYRGIPTDLVAVGYALIVAFLFVRACQRNGEWAILALTYLLGAMGNVLDFTSTGAVTDFIAFRIGNHLMSTNMADLFAATGSIFFGMEVTRACRDLFEFIGSVRARAPRAAAAAAITPPRLRVLAGGATPASSAATRASSDAPRLKLVAGGPRLTPAPKQAGGETIGPLPLRFPSVVREQAPQP